MMVTAYSIVVRSAPSGAVLCTASVSASLILGASSPINLASHRIVMTSAATTTVSTMPIVQPMTQPVLLPPAARTCGSMAGSSDRFGEVADWFQARVDRGQPLRHRAGELGHGLHPAGGRDERLVYRPEMKDHPDQAERGDGEDQRRDDQGCPGSCWHGCSPSLSCSAEELRDGAGVTDRADRDFVDRGVGRGQGLGKAVELADQGDPADQDVVGRSPDPLKRGEHPVEQEDDDRQYDEQQD